MKNVFKYEEPLDPENDKDSLVPRQHQINEIISGIRKGKFWAVYGPRKIGKTTLLNQIRYELDRAYQCIYIDCRNSPNDPKLFYDWFCDEILQKTGVNKAEIYKTHSHEVEAPYEDLYHFLSSFGKTQKPKGMSSIFLIDDIEHVPALEHFLGIWRRIHESKNSNYDHMNISSVVITGSTNLIKLTVGESSPYNVAKQMQMEDFSKDDFFELSDRVFKHNKQILFKDREKSYLHSRLSGHPQMALHALDKLASRQKENSKPITRGDVDKALKDLLEENTCLKILKHQIRNDEQLQELIIDIFEGKEIPFFRHDEYSLKGTGIIKKDGKDQCTFRNEIFKDYLAGLKITKSLYLQAIENLMRSTVTAQNFEELSQQIVDCCAQFLNTEVCTLWKKAGIESDPELMLVAGKGLPDVANRLDLYYRIYPSGTPENLIKGIISDAASNKRPICINSFDELSKHPSYDGKFHETIWKTEPKEKFKSLLILPLIFEEKVLGVIRWENSDTPNGFSDDDMKLAQKLQPFIAIVLRSMNYRQERIRTRQNILKGLAELLLQGPHKDDLNQQVVDKVAGLLHADICSLWLYSRERKTLRLSAAKGINFPISEAPEYELDMDIQDDKNIEGITAWIGIRNKPFYARNFNELKSHPSWRGKWDHLQWGDSPKDCFSSLFGVPLSGEKNNIKGILKIERMKAKNPFNDVDRAVLDLMSSMVSLGLTLNSQLREDIIYDFFHLLKQPASNAIMVLGELTREFNKGAAASKERIDKRLEQLARNLETIKGWSGNVYATATGEPYGEKDTQKCYQIQEFIKELTDGFVLSFPNFTFHTEEILLGHSLSLTDIEKRKFKVALYNILFNCIKYSSKMSQATISTELTADEDLALKIKDFGQGIAADDLPFIFDKNFTRGADRWPESLGMGLATVERLLNEFGWNKKVISEVNKGTEFTIYIPKDRWRNYANE